jgi:hypothetical protein
MKPVFIRLNLILITIFCFKIAISSPAGNRAPVKPKCNATSIRQLLKSGNLPLISKRFGGFIRQNNEDCVFECLNQAFANYLHSADNKNFRVINQLSCYFDGYITEYCVDFIPRLIRGHRDFYFKSLYRSKNNCLKNFTKHNIEMYDADAGIKKILRRTISKTPPGKYRSFLQSLLP